MCRFHTKFYEGLYRLLNMNFACVCQDWCSDAEAHRWSYFASRMRSAIALPSTRVDQSPIEFVSTRSQSPPQLVSPTPGMLYRVLVIKTFRAGT